MRHSWFLTYASALDAVCNEICIDDPDRVPQCRRHGQYYAESIAPIPSTNPADTANDSR
jgi:hypothetical protein